ncbi:DUF309 domain-containing protein [Sulfuracidifex metallicus]|uniref:DUF309 domain-containing protein n=1 Tax=Sulfuracidifex metallicus TaxID=47303 RepID=UPI0022746B6F|nr:DUF309 domain-containing protein [Sulfuracidifex metallicus]MCY0849890.1 DUF309 domain-containing protein [Sulfuracidifex metallicus]
MSNKKGGQNLEEDRHILFYRKDVYFSSLKDKLREGSNVIDIRNGLKYLEIDIIGNYDYVINVLGRPLFMSHINQNGNFQLFWEGRFWEVHEFVESKWRAEADGELKDFYQGLILVCASMIKFNKGESEISDKLMEKALRLFLRVSDSKINTGLKVLYGE